MKKQLAALFAALLLAACTDSAQDAPPAPHTLTESATGYYCTMNLSEHDGPKAQLFINSKPNEPIWFSTVTQLFGFVRHPGEPRDIAALYVTDMGQVRDWRKPNADNAWTDAKTAYYVIESRFIGGMGTLDALPFADAAKAREYVKQNGGRIVSFDEMPDSFIYSNPVGNAPAAAPDTQNSGSPASVPPSAAHTH